MHERSQQLISGKQLPKEGYKQAGSLVVSGSFPAFQPDASSSP